MQRRTILTIFFLSVFLTAATLNAAVDDKTAYVKVRTTKLRSTPQLFGPVVSNLKYGDSVTTLETSGTWYKVIDSGGRQGYIHVSAISDRKVILQASNKDLNTIGDSSEVVLAGKGFNQQVENEYAAANASLNFKAVDTMEKYKVSEGDLRGFIRGGNLKAEG